MMYILGLGSNIGDRRQQLATAVRKLSGVLVGMRQSRIYECNALLPDGAPEAWDVPFLNMAVAGESELDMEMLLMELKKIERDMGRQVRGFWGPREIDIDILAAGDTVVDMPHLNIPHHELLNRDFALLPLVDIVPEWRYPADGSYKGWKACDIASAMGYKTGGTITDAGRLDA